MPPRRHLRRTRPLRGWRERERYSPREIGALVEAQPLAEPASRRLEVSSLQRHEAARECEPSLNPGVGKELYRFRRIVEELVGTIELVRVGGGGREVEATARRAAVITKLAVEGKCVLEMFAGTIHVVAADCNPACCLESVGSHGRRRVFGVPQRVFEEALARPR